MGLFGVGGGDGGGGFNIFDPLGLMPMIKDGLDGLMNPNGKAGSGDVKELSANVMSAIGMGKDISAAFGSSDVPELPGATKPDANEPAVTEMQPPSDPTKAGDGYAKKEEPASTSAQATASESPVSTSQAATKAERVPKEELKALETMAVNFQQIQNGHWLDNDGLANIGNLESYIMDPKNPQHVRDAVRYVLERPELLTHLQGMSGRNDGLVSGEGIAEYLKLRLAENASAAKPPAAPPSGVENKSAATASPTGNSKVKAELKDAGWTPDKGAAMTKAANESARSERSAATDAYIPPSTSFESAIGNMDTRLHGMEDQMNKYTDDMIKGMAPDATPEQKLKGQEAEKMMSMLNLRYQALQGIRKQMFELLSNLNKTYSDMSLHAIGNIR